MLMHSWTYQFNTILARLKEQDNGSNMPRGITET